MRTLLKKFRLNRKRRELRQHLDLVYRERADNLLLEKHLIAQIGNVDRQFMELSINARR